jgi:DNA-binding NarL/FixJ family response regulator
VPPETHEPPLPLVQLIGCDRRVRDGLASLLTASGQVRVSDGIEDPASAPEVVGREQPDAIVVDLQVVRAPAGAPEFLATLRAHAPAARILVIAWNGESDRWVRRAGADGVLHVDGRPTELIEAIVPRSSSAL